MNHNTNAGTITNPIEIDGSDTESVASIDPAAQEQNEVDQRRYIHGSIARRPDAQVQRRTVIRNGRTHFYDPSAAPKRQVVNILRHNRVADGDETGPLVGPVTVIVTFWFQATQLHQLGQLYTNTPDIDNLQKFLYDAMKQADFFGDDSQIVRASVVKRYCSEMGAENYSHTTYNVFNSDVHDVHDD